eukprot:152656-Rhodomonas_salina.3
MEDSVMEDAGAGITTCIITGEMARGSSCCFLCVSCVQCMTCDEHRMFGKWQDNSTEVATRSASARKSLHCLRPPAWQGARPLPAAIFLLSLPLCTPPSVLCVPSMSAAWSRLSISCFSPCSLSGWTEPCLCLPPLLPTTSASQ